MSNENFIICYPYGSINYGTKNVNSDLDYIAIVENKLKDQENIDNCDYTYYTISEFQHLIDQHHISALECLFLLDSSKFFKFDLDLFKLRESISKTSSNSFVKAKKKFIVEKDRDIYKGKKSLFHSLRILDFGTQIAKYNKIIDFTSCAHLWKEIIENPSECWEDYNKKYKPVFNSMATEFRKFARKK